MKKFNLVPFFDKKIESQTELSIHLMLVEANLLDKSIDRELEISRLEHDIVKLESIKEKSQEGLNDEDIETIQAIIEKWR